MSLYLSSRVLTCVPRLCRQGDQKYAQLSNLGQTVIWFTIVSGLVGQGFVGCSKKVAVACGVVSIPHKMFYQSDLLFLEPKVPARENDSEQSRQVQNGGRDAISCF